MMWRPRGKLLRSCVSFFMLLASLAVCSMIVASSLPDTKRHITRSRIDAPVALVSFTSIQEVEIVPAVYQTGPIGPAERQH